MRSWDETLAAALLGTARRPPPRPEEGGRLGVLLATVVERPAEQALLSAAGTLAVVRRAGVRPETVDGAPLPPPAEPDERPAPPSAAATHLRIMLDGEHDDALPEWLDVAAGRGYRAPYEAVPDLLDTATGWDDLRERAAGLAGPRGRWLAAQETGRWPWLGGDASSTVTDEEFATADRDTREAILAELRATDPARARELLAATWDDEAPEDRVRLLATFADGLGPDDEPFLEQALADRRKPVRTLAATLLSRLPDSAFATRIAAVAGPILELQGGLRGRRLEVRPPEALDPALGLDAKAPKGRGERAHALVQLLAHAPLRTWSDRLDASADEIVAARLPREWAREVREGWLQAAIVQRDSDWARALAEVLPHPDLLAVLAPADRERAVARKLRDRHEVELPVGAGVWGEELSRAVVDRLDHLATAPGQPLDPIVAALAPPVLADAEQVLQPLAERPDWSGRPAARALSLIHFRRAMLAALTEEPRA